MIIYIGLLNNICKKISGNKIGLKENMIRDIIIYVIIYMEIMWMIYETIVLEAVIEWKWYKIVNFSSMTIENKIIISKENILIVWLVTIITISVLIYTVYYMGKIDNRLSLYLSMFSNSMLIFMISNNNIIVLSAYEYIGITSYILINNSKSRLQSNKSSILAMICGKIGDMGLMVGIIYKYINVCNFNNSLVLKIKWIVIKIGLSIAIMSKSGQIILLNWLILAMNAPTPVSSLLLSSTLVTSGVYLIVKMNIILSIMYTYIGIITIIMISIGGLMTLDGKKIIALSTSSQLGYILIIRGLNDTMLLNYLIITLGLVKNLLFLGIGVIINNNNGDQDIRKLKNKESDIWAILTITISTLGIIGLPYLSIYYSKELILFYSMNYIGSNIVELQSLLIIGSILTILYSIRLIVNIIQIPQIVTS